MILTQKLEGISKKIFERYKKKVIQYIGNKPGVYALYDGKELYYVGRASDLVKRVNHHLKDRHSALWTHFSVYFTKKAQYANDIEAVIISIAQPKGNKAKPKLGKERKLKDILRQAIKESHQEELRELGLGRATKGKKNKSRLNLKNYFKSSRPLRKSYKGKIYIRLPCLNQVKLNTKPNYTLVLVQLQKLLCRSIHQTQLLMVGSFGSLKILKTIGLD